MSQPLEPIIYKPKRPRPSMDAVLLIASGIGTSLMAGIAMHALLPETGALAWGKAMLIAVLAGGVAYAVNRFAVERGAPLAATGYVTAGLMSVCSILFIGAGLFASTYAGMTLSSVAELQLHDHGRRLDDYAATQMQSITQGTRAIPVVELIRDDLRSKASCEVTTSCVSGNDVVGRGPVARTLELIADRADAIAKQLAAGEAVRQDLALRVAGYLADYQRVLGDTDTPLSARRRDLIAIDGRIDQAISALKEAIPLSLLGSYAAELKQGVAMEGNAGARVNALLASHGRALDDVLGTLEGANAPAPAFPPRAGVSSTFDYILHFMPIAAITAVVELILPIALWVYTFIAIVWDKEQAQRRRPAAPLAASENNGAEMGGTDRERKAGGKSPNHRNRMSGQKNRKPHGRMNGSAAYYDPTEDDISDYLANAGRGLKGDQ
jgi:hypothetical protein